jgi:hypothetical protein
MLSKENFRMPIHYANNSFTNLDVGIRAKGPVDITAENNYFHNVGTPYDIAGARSADIRGTRITNDPKFTNRNTRAFAGWTKPNGPPLPAFCPSCKSIFPSKNYNFGGRFFTVWGNEETCPECGFEHAKLSEGIFDLASEAVKVLSAPDITHAMLAALRKASDKVVAGKIEPENAAAELDIVSQKLGMVFRKAFMFGKPAITFLLAIVGAYYAKGSYEYAELSYEEQVRQGQVQQLSKAANASSTGAIESMLEALRELHFTSKGMHQNPNTEATCRPSAGPPAHEATREPGSIKLLHERKPKNMTVAHHKPSSSRD